MTFSTYIDILHAYDTPFNIREFAALPSRIYNSKGGNWRIFQHRDLDYAVTFDNNSSHIIFSTPSTDRTETLCDLVSEVKHEYVSSYLLDAIGKGATKLGFALAIFSIYDGWGFPSVIMFYSGLSLMLASLGIAIKNKSHKSDFKILDKISFSPNLKIMAPKIYLGV